MDVKTENCGSFCGGRWGVFTVVSGLLGVLIVSSRDGMWRKHSFSAVSVKPCLVNPLFSYPLSSHSHALSSVSYFYLNVLSFSTNFLITLKAEITHNNK